MVTQDLSRRYKIIDIFRLYCAGLILLIHCLEVSSADSWAMIIKECFSKQAVPFFFITSGFFLGTRYDKKHDLNCFWKFGKKNLILYGIWMLLWSYRIVEQYKRLYPKESFIRLSLILFRRIVFAGYGVYWFLLVLAEAVIIIGIAVKFNKTKILVLVSLVGLTLSYWYRFSNASLIHKVFYTLFSWENNVIMMGIPYVTIGFLLSKYKPKISNRQIYCLFSGYVLFSLFHLLLYKAFLLKMIGSYHTIFEGVQALLLFLIGISIAGKHISVSISHMAREYSGVLFLLHTVFIYEFIDRIWGIHGPLYIRFCGPLLLSLVVYLTIRRINNRALRYIFLM